MRFMKMIDVAFDMSSLPLGPYHILAHFPRGRDRLTTQSVVRSSHVLAGRFRLTNSQVGMATAVRLSGMPISVPKVYAFKDTPDGIGAEVVLFEKVRRVFVLSSLISHCVVDPW